MDGSRLRTGSSLESPDCDRGSGADAQRTAAQRIFLVDDHRVFVDLLELALAENDGFRCIGSATSVDQAIEVAATTPFDVGLIDVHLPHGDGIEFARKLRELQPEARTIILTADLRPGVLDRALDAGASAVLAKHGPLQRLVHALRVASPQRPVIDPGFHRRPNHGLTPRELQVLEHLGRGHRVAAIAAELSISRHTARDHIKSVLAKFNATSQLEAVVLAQRQGILRLDEP